MPPSRPAVRTWIAALITGVSGLLIGLTAGLLVGHGVDSAWFSAVGVWFGAVGTVLTVITAVVVFRFERAERERVAESERLRAQAVDLSEAALLIVNAKAATTSGTSLLGLTLTVSNGSSRVASHVRAGVSGHNFIDLNPAGPPGQVVELILPPTTSHYWILQATEPLENSVTNGYLTNSSLQPWVSFQMGGQEWFRLGQEQPHRVT